MKTQIRFLLLTLFAWLGASAQPSIQSSFPASDRVVLLDFDGHLVQGTPWNGSGDIACVAATLSTAEMASIFNRVAEDFRPFTLNITTDSTKYDAAPIDKRMRVVITPTSSWYGMAGGVAFVNSFTWGNNTPCFVFSTLLGNNTKNIAEAVSHEIGHTLGLRHQSSYDAVCNKIAEYNAGTGGGEIGWAPIMGVGYYRNMTLWNYGANPYGCTYYQDDLSIITANVNGVGFRADDHGGDALTASTATVAANAFAVDGIIERPADVDVVGFTMAISGRLKVEALPFSIASGNVGANVDLRVELLDSNGTSLRVCNDAGTLHTSLDTMLSAGRYFIAVQSLGNVYAPNYAVLGSYTLRGELIPITPLPLHKLQLKGLVQNKVHHLNWEVVADERIVQQTLEASQDGRTFVSVATPSSTTRSYTQQPPHSTMQYYRLRVGFDNGRTYLSNTIVLGNEASGRPALLASVASSALMVTSPAPYQYAVFDARGSRLVTGFIPQGFMSIPLPALASGLYFIRFNNGGQTHTERFLRP